MRLFRQFVACRLCCRSTRKTSNFSRCLCRPQKRGKASAHMLLASPQRVCMFVRANGGGAARCSFAPNKLAAASLLAPRRRRKRIQRARAAHCYSVGWRSNLASLCRQTVTRAKGRELRRISCLRRAHTAARCSLASFAAAAALANCFAECRQQAAAPSPLLHQPPASQLVERRTAG